MNNGMLEHSMPPPLRGSLLDHPPSVQLRELTPSLSARPLKAKSDTANRQARNRRSKADLRVRFFASAELVVLRCDGRSNQTSIVMFLFPFLVTWTNIKEAHTQVQERFTACPKTHDFP